MDALRSHVQPASERLGDVFPFRIGGATVEPETREVTIHGVTERIQQQPLRVLLLLRRNSGRLVTRDEIVEQCWDRRIVGDDVINRAILILRKLAERAGGFRIETIPRAGYRLIEDGVVDRRGRSLALAIAAVLTLAVAAVLYLHQGRPAAAVPTVSVLPITVEGGGSGARTLADSIERSVAGALTEIGVRVAPRDEGDLIVWGKVTATSIGPRVEMIIGLGPKRASLQSRWFERPWATADDLPSEIAARMAQTLAVMGPLLAIDGRPADPEIAERMFAALDAAATGNAIRAYEILARAAREHPESVATQMALAITSGATLETFSMPERRAHVRTAREILERRKDEARLFGDFGHAWCLLRPRTWLADCERELRAASENPSPGNSSGQRLSELIADVGRLEEASMLARVTAARHPYSSGDTGVLLQLLEIQGRHREAEAVYAEAVRKWPGNWSLRWNRIMGLSGRGDFASLERFAATIPQTEFTFDAAVLQSALAAYRQSNRAGIARACSGENMRNSTRNVCVALLAAAGELDRSFAMASALYPKQVGRNPAEDEELWLQQPAYFTMTLLSAPAGAPLRRDARFLQLAKQTGLLRYWRAGKLPDFCTRTPPEPVCRHLRNGA